MTRTEARQYRDVPVDVKVVLSGLWVAMLLAFAYVDILGYLRADILKAALDGKVATTSFTVDQAFLAYSVAYVLVPIAMVVVSLLAAPRVNRILNVVVSLVYLVTVVGSCVGESHAYYLLGSAVEVVLLAAIARTAWTWPPPQAAAPPVATGRRLDDQPASRTHVTR